MVNVDTHFGNQLCCKIPVVLLNVRDPVVRSVGLAFAMTEDKDRSRWCEFVGNVLPVGRTVIFVCSRWIPSFVVNLVEPPTWIGCDDALGSHARFRISGVDERVTKRNGDDHVPAPKDSPILISHHPPVFSSNIFFTTGRSKLPLPFCIHPQKQKDPSRPMARRGPFALLSSQASRW
jgi:hypothetical protein